MNPLQSNHADYTGCVLEDNKRPMAKSICILNDSASSLEGLESLLTQNGFSVVQLQDTDEFHEHLAQETPDLILLPPKPLQRNLKTIEQLKELNEELYNRNSQVEKELYSTRQLQQSLLPPFLQVKPNSPDGNPFGDAIFAKLYYRENNLQVSGTYMPCDMLGGDLYDVMPFSESNLGICVADVSGHGVPAGFVTAIFKAALWRVSTQGQTPGQVLEILNNELAELIKTGEYITGFYLNLNPQTGTFTYSGAGHPYPMHYHASTGTLTRLDKNSMPLVWIKDISYPCDTVTLSPGDKLFIFTDGASELQNSTSNIFSEDLLEETFLTLAQQNDPLLLDSLMEVLSNFSEGHPLQDDISMVLIEKT